LPSIIKVDQIQSDTGTVNVSSNLQFSGSSSTMQVGKTLYLANTNNFALDFQADVSGRLRIASSLSTFGDNNPFIIERPSSVGGQNDAITIRAGGVVDLGKGQLKFPASQNASSDPNTLDDYEEGTWTGTIWAGSTEGTNTTSTWRYTKIGRLVYITGETAYAQTWPTGGVFELRGLPFAMDGPWASGVCYMPGVGTTFRVVVPIIFSSYSSSIRFVDNSKGSGGSWVGSEISSSDFRPSTTTVSMVYATST